MKKHSTEEAVRYVETDRMRLVHHSTYLYWFEIGRTGLLGAAGFPYHELEASGVLFPVIEYACRLVGSADYGDRVRVDTHVTSLRSRTVEFSYEAFNKDKLIVTGMSRHVAVDTDHKPRRMPAELIAGLRNYLDQ